MVQMKKVGLVTCYFHPNYGSMLQAYATQKILDDWQIPCENSAIDGLRQGIDRAKTRFYLKQWHNPQVFTGTILRIVGKRSAGASTGRPSGKTWRCAAGSSWNSRRPISGCRRCGIPGRN